MAGSRRAPLVVAGVVGVLLIAVVRSVTGGDDKPASTTSKGPTKNDSCTVVHLTASSEKAALLKQLASDWDGKVKGAGCARVQVTSKASGGAADALARGWDEAVDGPRPDVWSPAASSWTQLLRQKTTAVDKPDLVGSAVPPSIASSPLVIAMPKPMATALGWPGKPLGWGDVLKLAQDKRGWASVGQQYGAFTLGKTNPNFSTSGLHATIGTYVAATGTSSDLTLADLRSKRVQAYAQAVERAVVHYGDTTLTFLSNLQQADDNGRGLSYISAVAVEEKSVWDYNQGNPTGDPATLGQHRKPHTPLVAIYPKEGTLLSDSPYVVLQAPWVQDDVRTAAAAFLSYVRGDKAQDRFTKAAFRRYDGKPGSVVNEGNGLLPREPKLVLRPPAPNVLAQVQQLWAQQRKPAKVLLVIDVSGSMGEPVGADTKLELAKSAALRALNQFSPRDDVALWAFSTPLDGARDPYRQLVPFTPVAQGKALLRKEISALNPEGGTALYATARRAYRAMSSGVTSDRISAVVLLTDGRNEYNPDTDLASLERELSPEDTALSVRFFPIGYGADADLPTLRGIAEAARGAAYDASDPASIDKVFTAVLSNF
ncbi:MAG TPA: substrate-binding and VWA domain-containing protein [Mycobacteriales bacterium]|nr:substrate-binding and VWA domain-containing protein [Mycobacteriales bacterium]